MPLGLRGSWSGAISRTRSKQLGLNFKMEGIITAKIDGRFDLKDMQYCNIYNIHYTISKQNKVVKFYFH